MTLPFDSPPVNVPADARPHEHDAAAYARGRADGATLVARVLLDDYAVVVNEVLTLAVIEPTLGTAYGVPWDVTRDAYWACEEARS